jgi:adenylyltransferase/sulfurtransferase
MDEIAESCSETGVLAPVAGIIGSIQATETLKILTGVGETLNGRLLILDARTMEWRELKLRRDPDCPVCGKP